MAGAGVWATAQAAARQAATASLPLTGNVYHLPSVSSFYGRPRADELLPMPLIFLLSVPSKFMENKDSPPLFTV